MRYPPVLCAGILLALIAPSAYASVYVTGKVVVRDRKAPAAGVTIALYPDASADSPVAVVESLQNGSFVLKAPEAGHYRLVIQGPAYSRQEQSVNVPAEGLSGRVFTVEHLPSIRLRLIAPDGQPVRSGAAEVSLSLSSGGSPYGNPGNQRRAAFRGRAAGLGLTQPVDDNGNTEILLPEGFPTASPAGLTLTARVAAAGCAQLQLETFPTDILTVKLQPGLTLAGTALDSHGKPLAGLPVSVFPLGRSAYGGRRRQTGPMAVTDVDGRFKIPALLPGNYMVRAMAPDGARYLQQVQIDEAAANSPVTLSPAAQ